MTNHHANSDQQPPAGSAAMYARVASQEKRGQAQKPRDNLINLAQQQGFDDTRIILFEDNGVSGNTPIDKREGLSSLVQAIANGTIHVVFVADENRLFRDIFAVDFNSFIRLCEDHHIRIITPEILYDFTNPRDVNLFRVHFQQAFVSIQDAANEWFNNLLEED